MNLNLIGLLFWLIVVGLICWLLTAYLLPLMPQPLRIIIIVVLVIIAIIWLASLLGIGTGIHIVHANLPLAL